MIRVLKCHNLTVRSLAHLCNASRADNGEEEGGEDWSDQFQEIGKIIEDIGNQSPKLCITVQISPGKSKIMQTMAFH